MRDVMGAQALTSAPRIGVLGDTHGDMQHVLIVSRTMQTRGVSALIVLGDFGFVWPGGNWDNDLDKLSRRLALSGQTLFFVDGNHEDFTRLYKFPVANDGLRWLRPNIAHIPRGWRTTLASGRTLAALGGANSVDVADRRVGKSWWPEESITEADLTVLGNEHADILIGHDAPLHVPQLDSWLKEAPDQWPSVGIEYADAGRAMFHRGFMQVQPTLYLGGHYHHHVDETVHYGGGLPFESRVVLLDKNDSRSATSQAILATETLELGYLTQDGRPVESIAGRNSGQRWRPM